MISIAQTSEAHTMHVAEQHHQLRALKTSLQPLLAYRTATGLHQALRATCWQAASLQPTPVCCYVDGVSEVNSSIAGNVKVVGVRNWCIWLHGRAAADTV
jgi:hypothetical protein